MSKQFFRRIAFCALACTAGTVAVTGPAASAGQEAAGKVRLCNHGKGYSPFIAFTTNKHTHKVAPGHCSAWRPSIKVGKLVYVQGVRKGDVFQIGSYKVPAGTYQVDTHGNRRTATFHVNHK